jgi:hypothetical protein
MSPLFKSMANMTGGNPSQDVPTQHGFFMLGTSTVFFYHSAQFTMENHSYQMIYTVNIPAEALSVYTADVQELGASGDWVWIFVNGIGNDPPPDQLFTLPQIQIGAVTSLTGSIIRISTGSAPSVTIVPQVTLSVQRLVYFRHFDYSMSYPAPLPYILFGDASGAYLAHYLTKLEDFDNLAQLAALPSWLDPQQLEAGVQIDFPSVPYQPGQLPSASPLAANTTYGVLFGGVGDPSFTVDVQSIYWFDITAVNAPS